MMPGEAVPADDGTVRDRLIRAADAEIAERGINAVQMDVVATRAGVSRATAFRQLGSVAELLVQVALLRARRHVAAVEALMAKKVGVLAKIEAALVYTTRELPTDPSISALMAQGSASVHHPHVHQVAVDAMAPTLREGQRSGEIRTDLDIDELIDFLVEQTYLAAQELDRSDAAVRKRFRAFIVPAIAATSGERLGLTREAQESVAVAIEALTDLAAHLTQDVQSTIDTPPGIHKGHERKP
ncbi:TetR/AcrR family transcriptional regulator [Mycobacterium sp. E2497]|uniref:TetR/AcrR family transcriptional regulator n=1 Tax=Mycobacterium sp. E2497 TaxID=1834135 RepID=UPI00080152E9|nr:TetR/AcrR family transcriptional regulator [Mycobacterium sp. E2497]OBI19267.1 TetR family transcriptional regulator [Mycobacterium sp. E2497]